MQRVTRTAITGTEPVSMAELKAQLRITSTADDAYLQKLIPRAREVAEKLTRRSIIAQSLTLSLDFKGMQPRGRDEWWDGVREGSILMFTPAQLTLLQPPTQTIVQVRTYDVNDQSSVFSASNYRLDNSDPMQYARLVLTYGAIWPAALRYLNSIQIDVTAGWADGTVPEGIQGAIADLAAWAYTHRAPCNESSACACGAAESLRPYTMMEASS